jgi:hypothetical protein
MQHVLFSGERSYQEMNPFAWIWYRSGIDLEITINNFDCHYFYE